MRIYLFLIIGIFTGRVLEAHEGHSHGSLSAPHGGAVYDGKRAGLELIQEGKKIKLYPVDGNWKLIPIANVEASAQIEFPKKKAEAISLIREKDHFSVEVDAKGAHRYQLVVTLSLGAHKENLKIQVEPQ